MHARTDAGRWKYTPHGMTASRALNDLGRSAAKYRALSLIVVAAVQGAFFDSLFSLSASALAVGAFG
jgi:hypothetical protein